VKPVAFEYVAAHSLEEALAALATGGDDAKPIAGGQSLVPALNLRLVRPTLLVDLNHAGLDALTADGELSVGATVRQAALGRCAEAHPLVREALPHLGHTATRSRGTVGGSVAHADGAAELPLCLVALDGAVVVEGPAGPRRIPADDLFVTHYTTTLEPGELLTHTVWPLPRPDERAAFEEHALRAGDYGLSMVAVVVRCDEAGQIVSARVAVGAVTDRPTRLLEVERLLLGARVEAAAGDAGALAARLVEPHGSLHASARYLKALTGTLVERALRRAA
jgi:carbon-monoxide dehydrogenase medium subunit